MSADWQRHAALLDLQPSNRRLLQEAVTPRQQPADIARMSFSDQIERGAGFAGLIVWGVFVVAALMRLLGGA